MNISNMGTFEKNSSWSSSSEITKFPIQRLEPSIQKFLKVIETDLDRLKKHRLNIEKYSRIHDWTNLNKEQINTTRTVQQIAATVREIEKTRRTIQDNDLPKFDEKIEHMKSTAIVAIKEFVEVEREDNSKTSADSTEEGTLSHPLLPNKHVDDVNVQLLDSGMEQLQIKPTPENTEAMESWENLHHEAADEDNIHSTKMTTDDEEKNDQVQVYLPAGTPTVEIRTNTCSKIQTLLDIPTGSVVSLDETITDMDKIMDFIPEVLPYAESRISPSVCGIKEIIRSHRADFICADHENPLLMEVRREHVLDDAMSIIRVSQEDLHNPLTISFIGEDGVDLGGLRREFWTIFVHQFGHSAFVTGSFGKLTFQNNFLERKKNTYYYLGQLVALSILEDGPGLPLFSETVTDYILEGEVKQLYCNDLPDYLIEKLEEIDNSSDEVMKKKYQEIFDQASDVGFLVPASTFTKKHVPSLRSAFLEYQVSSCKAELDQFIRGLDTHQIHSLLTQDDNCKKSRGLLSGSIKPLTVVALRKQIEFKYSDGNRKLIEMATAQGFLTFIQATKGHRASINNIELKPADVLMWLTGARQIPAAGFHKLIDVEFGDSTSVNTCALTLTLKLQENMSPSDAVLYYTELLVNSQTFGKE